MIYVFLAEGFDGLRAEQSAGPTVLRGLWIEGDGAEPRPYRVQSNESRLPRKKVQPDKLRLHLLLMAVVLRQLVSNLIPPYQAARTKTLVR